MKTVTRKLLQQTSTIHADKILGQVARNEMHIQFHPKKSVVCNHPLDHTSPEEAGEDRGRDSAVTVANASAHDAGNSTGATVLYGYAAVLKTASSTLPVTLTSSCLSCRSAFHRSLRL